MPVASKSCAGRSLLGPSKAMASMAKARFKLAKTIGDVGSEDRQAFCNVIVEGRAEHPTDLSNYTKVAFPRKDRSIADVA